MLHGKEKDMKQIDAAIEVLKSFLDFSSDFDEKRSLEETIWFLEKISSYGSYGEIIEILDRKKNK
jgi:mannitol/fructose-specific phosphotransferase system IIA component (Ntr-type)